MNTPISRKWEPNPVPVEIPDATPEEMRTLRFRMALDKVDKNIKKQRRKLKG